MCRLGKESPLTQEGGIVGGIAEETFPEVVKNTKEERVLRRNYFPITREERGIQAEDSVSGRAWDLSSHGKYEEK